jgi:hypothetical protein
MDLQSAEEIAKERRSVAEHLTNTWQIERLLMRFRA